MRYGVATARRAWLSPSDVLNTLPVAEFAARVSGGRLFRPEEVAFDDAVDEASQAVAGGFGSVHNAVDFCAVTEADRRAGGEDRELPRHVQRERAFVGEQEFLQVADVAEGAAVGQDAGGIDRERVVEGEGLSVLAGPGTAGTLSSTPR